MTHNVVTHIVYVRMCWGTIVNYDTRTAVIRVVYIFDWFRVKL